MCPGAKPFPGFVDPLETASRHGYRSQGYWTLCCIRQTQTDSPQVKGTRLRRLPALYQVHRVNVNLRPLTMSDIG